MYCFNTKQNDTDAHNYSNNYERLLIETQKLKKENEELRVNIQKIENNWIQDIDAFVDEWYEENKDTVDIGVINFRFFKIDLFPDYIEKHIYKKMLKIMFSFFKNAVSPKK